MSTDLQTEFRVASTPHSPERWALLMPHRARLVKLATSKLGDPNDAEDCVHEALLRTLAFSGLDDQRAGRFLTTVTVRLCVDHHRAKTRTRTLVHRLWDGGHAEGPEDRICDQLAGAWLRDRLLQLSDREREVMQTRADGLSTPEAAARLGISRKAAESAFTRARAKMASHAALAA